MAGIEQETRMTSRLASVALTVITLATPSARAQTDEPAPGASSPAAASPALGAAFVDPLGFLLFGPTLGAELALGQFSVVAYGRWLDVGMLARSMFESGNDKFAFSYGGGLKGRYYFKSGLVGPYVDVAIEVLKTRMENQVDRIAINNFILVPEVEGGYRIALGRFFIGIAAGIGYAQQVSKGVENINGGNQAASYSAKDVSTFYGSGNVDLGVLF
jgi:hypothetical protein